MRIARRYLALLVSLSLTAHAETLEEAWASALANNANFAAAARQHEAAAARQAAANALDWPTLDVAASAVHLNSTPSETLDTSALTARLAGTPLAGVLPSAVSTPLSDRNISVADIAITYPLFTSGRISATQRAADAGVTLAEANEANTRQALKLNVAEAYLNVQRAASAQIVATQYRDSLLAHRNDVAAMEKQGMAAPVERMTADVALAEAERKLIDANQAVALSQSAYNRLLGRSLDAPVNLSPIAPAPINESQEDLNERAIQHRPELSALSAGQQALHEQAKAVRGQGGPQVALQAMQLQWHGLPLTESHASTIGIVMHWSLFDAGLNRHQAGALHAEAEAVAEQRQDAMSLILLDVKHAQLEQIAAQERVRVAKSTNELAAEALRLTQSRYHNGLSTQTEVLAAETRLADANRANNDANFDLLLAQLRLRRAIGEL